jgi:hypothetical protein
MRSGLYFAAIAVALGSVTCGVNAIAPAPDAGGADGGGASVRQDTDGSFGGGGTGDDASAMAGPDGGGAGATLDAASDDAALTDAGPADAAPSIACPATSLAPGDYIQTLPFDGGTRTFSIHVPAGLDATRPAPLVLAFHGGGQNAWQFEGFTHLHAKSDAAGFVLVEPDGTPALGPSPVPPPSPDAGVVL